MLPKRFRLKNKQAFNATYRLNNTSFKDGIVLYAGKEKKTEMQTLVGFVVSKKVHKRAVKRNRLKRLMRESYRLLLKNNNLGNSQNRMSLIFVATKSALNKNFKEIDNAITTLISGLE